MNFNLCDSRSSMWSDNMRMNNANCILYAYVHWLPHLNLGALSQPRNEVGGCSVALAQMKPAALLTNNCIYFTFPTLRHHDLNSQLYVIMCICMCMPLTNRNIHDGYHMQRCDTEIDIYADRHRDCYVECDLRSASALPRRRTFRTLPPHQQRTPHK